MVTLTVTSSATLPAPTVVFTSSAAPSCRCPEWHVLRLFGHGRHRASFEAGDEGLVGLETDSVCAVCGHGLSRTPTTTATAGPSPDGPDRA
jgi:hypothetical protein